MATSSLTSGSDDRGRTHRRGARLGRSARSLALAVLATAATVVAAAAQSSANQREEWKTREDGGPPERIQRLPRGFRLFAEEDLAMVGMRMTGGNGTYMANTGPCSFYFNIDSERCFNRYNAAGTAFQTFFNVDFIAGAPINEYRKIREVHRGITNMIPPLGYTVPYTIFGNPPVRQSFWAADAQLNNLFSGDAAATNDGSCRDFSSLLNGRVPVGMTLGPASDCLATWPRAGWLGKRPIIDDSLVAAFRANPATFQFNDWQLPARAFDTTQFLGTFSTYGKVSDFYRELLPRFGSVTRLGSGNPQNRGYPLGLDIRYDAFQFARPSIRSVVFYQVTIVNRSDLLYGQGINYDSLYFGLNHGFVALVGGTASGQSAHAYQDPQRGAVIFGGGNTSNNCGASYPRRFTGAGACGSTTGRFNGGAVAFVVLKSPIGDLRNKQFSNPSSPFYNPTSRLADDTITFNHVRRNGFGGTFDNSYGRSDRAAFGLLAGMEDLFLDGRSISDFTPAQLFTYFQSEDFDGAVSPQSARFNRFVPGATAGFGSWDYDDDGIQDTIKTPGCGRNGCARVWADTTAGGTVPLMGNQGNIVAAGPFKLGANDTTQFIFAFVIGPDSAGFEAVLNSTVQSYINNYAGPAPFPPPMFTASDVNVTPAEVRDSVAGVQTARVRIRIPPLSAYRDPFIQRVLDRLRTSNEPTVARLRRLNPNLVTAVERRVTTNLSQILIFKSCDNGLTFTTSTTAQVCNVARATGTDQRAIEFGWQPIATINVDATTGQPATSFFQDDVVAGRRYLYSFVTRTRGLLDVPIVDSIGGQLVPTNLRDALALDVDPVTSPLFRSGPSVVSVYAPLTNPSGTVGSQLDAARIFGTGTEFIALNPGSTVAPGRYRLIFANRFVVLTTRDTVTGKTTQRVIAERVLPRAAAAGGTAATNVVVSADTFDFEGTVVVRGATNQTVPGANRRVQTGTTLVTFTDTVVAAALPTSPAAPFGTVPVGYVLVTDTVTVNGQVVGERRALFISNIARSTSSTNAGSTTAFEASPNFPGFTFSFEALPATASTARLNRVLRQRGDTLNATVVNANGVIYQPSTTSTSISVYRGPGGDYEIQWQGDAFGPQAPFRLGTGPEMQPVLDQSLAARPVAQTTDVTTVTRDLVVATLQAQLGAATANTLIAGRPLVAAKLPFTVRGADGQPTTVAMFRRHASSGDSVVRNSILLGTAGDTTRLSVPPDAWMPGDSLFVIETVATDSVIVAGTGTTATTTTVVKDTTINGRTVQIPIRTTTRRVTFSPMILGCSFTNAVPNRFTCNPIALNTRAATGYLPYQNGWINAVVFARPFDLFGELRLNASAPQVSAQALTRARMARVGVVPNPYVVQSAIDPIDPARAATRRIIFTNVPLQGTLRIYSVSGQFLQQLTWTQGDLLANCLPRSPGADPTECQLTGDLPYDLRTREGLELGSGLYMYVLTATGPNANGQRARGKFVIIR